MTASSFTIVKNEEEFWEPCFIEGIIIIISHYLATRMKKKIKNLIAHLQDNPNHMS